MSEREGKRERLGTALLAASAKLVAAQAARQQIEDTEIVHELCADSTKAIRRLRHPEREAELRQEVHSLDELIQDQTELRIWILAQLEAIKEAA